MQFTEHHKIGRDQEEAGKEPCHRACDAGGKVAPQRHEPEAHHGAGNHLSHTGKHGKAGVPQTLNGVAVDDKHCQRDVEHTVPEDEVLRIGHNGGLACVQEQADQGLVQHAQDEEGGHAVHAADAQCGVHAAVHAAQILSAHILAGVGGHGGADAAYRGEIICIPEKELEIVLISNTTTYAMSKLADKAACIVLGLPDCTEPAVPEHENAPAHSGVFLTALPDDPMFVDITEQNGTFYMQREWCHTELVKEEDGGYRIGSLDEKIYFTDNGILYRLPGRVLTLTPAKPADPALFQEGTYYNDETDSFMKLVKVENTCEIHMRRHGKTTLYQSASGSIIFRMDANLVMYVKAENDTIIMDGGRIKHIIYQKQ